MLNTAQSVENGERFLVAGAERNRPARAGLPGIGHGGETAQEDLTRAFLTFTQAATSLERSYSQLQAEVTRLHQELERANVELDRSLEENARVREYLAKVVGRLPCGVVATNAQGEVQILNSEALKLLGIAQNQCAISPSNLPEVVQRLIGEIVTSQNKFEQELVVGGGGDTRMIGVLRENVRIGSDGNAEAIWILCDLTEQKRIAAEKEAARRSHALAELATVWRM